MNPNQPMVGPAPVAPPPQAPQPQTPQAPQTPPPMTPIGPEMANMPVQPEAKQGVNKTLIIIIVASVLLLVALLVVLLVVFGGNKRSQLVVNYKKNYACTVDDYNDGGDYDFELSLNEDNTYRFAVSESDYSIGTYQETAKQNKTDDNGVPEVDYHLSLKHEKDYLEGFDVTEESGTESEYVVNFSEESDIVVIDNIQGETTYYCKVK